MTFKKEYKTSSDIIIAIPLGIPYIIGNELAERFSYYGMYNAAINNQNNISVVDFGDIINKTSLSFLIFL